MNYEIKIMKKSDAAEVGVIDELTQKQYLGEKWEVMTDEEKNKCLVSKLKGFNDIVENGYSFVAKREGKILAFILAYELLPFENRVYVRYIAISPDNQGKGIGVRLYAELIKKAGENNVEQIISYINHNNPNSLKLHAKLGFEVIDRVQATFYIDK